MKPTIKLVAFQVVDREIENSLYAMDEQGIIYHYDRDKDVWRELTRNKFENMLGVVIS